MHGIPTSQENTAQLGPATGAFLLHERYFPQRVAMMPTEKRANCQESIRPAAHLHNSSTPKGEEVVRQIHQDQKHAPLPADCVKPYTARVLFSATVLNKRYQYEIVRSTRRADKLYFNCPYMRAHWRDGRIIQRRHFKKKDQSTLPRKVATVLKEYLGTHNLREEFEKAIAEYRKQGA